MVEVKTQEWIFGLPTPQIAQLSYLSMTFICVQLVWNKAEVNLAMLGGRK